MYGWVIEMKYEYIGKKWKCEYWCMYGNWMLEIGLKCLCLEIGLWSEIYGWMDFGFKNGLCF